MAVFIKVGGLLRGRFRVKSERSQGVEKKSGRFIDVIVDNQKVLKWILFIFGLSTLTQDRLLSDCFEVDASSIHKIFYFQFPSSNKYFRLKKTHRDLNHFFDEL